MERRGASQGFRVKTESVRRLSNFNFQWAKTLYEDNLRNYCILFYIFQGLKMSLVICSKTKENSYQGRPGFLGIQYIGVFNFRYTLFLCLKLGIKYSLTTNFGYKVYRGFLNFGILHDF